MSSRARSRSIWPLSGSVSTDRWRKDQCESRRADATSMTGGSRRSDHLLACAECGGVVEEECRSDDPRRPKLCRASVCRIRIAGCRLIYHGTISPAPNTSAPSRPVSPRQQPLHPDILIVQHFGALQCPLQVGLATTYRALIAHCAAHCPSHRGHMKDRGAARTAIP